MITKLHIFLVTFLLAPILGNAQNLSIQVCNKTGYDISYLKIDGFEFQHLANDTCSEIVFGESLTNDSGYIYPSITAKVVLDEGTIEIEPSIRRCGTSITQITEGNFKLDLILRGELGPNCFWVTPQE